MPFDALHARDVSVPSAVLLVGELFPTETGRSKTRLVERVTDYFMTSIRAYCDLAPPQPVPEPSRN